MTTDDRTLNFPLHGTVTLSWSAKNTKIEVEKEPGHPPTLSLNHNRMKPEELDLVIAALREARYSVQVLSRVFDSGSTPALAPGREEAPSEEGASVLVEGPRA